MRVNVYAEEMTDRVELVEKDGHVGLRFYLYLPCDVPLAIDGLGEHLRGPFTHSANDDDSAAVTFWGKRDMREALVKAIALLDAHYASREGSGRHLTDGLDTHYKTMDEGFG